MSDKIKEIIKGNIKNLNELIVDCPFTTSLKDDLLKCQEALAELEAKYKRIDELEKILIKEHSNRIKMQTKLEAENEKLKEFIRVIISGICWEWGDMDGCDLQDAAIERGLLVAKIATEEDVNELSSFEVGDTIYVFSDALKESRK